MLEGWLLASLDIFVDMWHTDSSTVEIDNLLQPYSEQLGPSHFNLLQLLENRPMGLPSSVERDMKGLDASAYVAFWER